MTEPLEFFTPKQLADRFNIPFRTVLKAISTRELEAARFSSSTLRIRAAEADRWFQSKVQK